jgi:hypothetical protein
MGGGGGGDSFGMRRRPPPAPRRALPRRVARVWLAAALALVLAPAAAAARDRVDLLDVPVVEVVEILPVCLPGEAAAAAAPPPAMVPGLLTQPAGWAVGDAAVVLVGEDRRPEDGLARRVAAALLAQGAAVLEMDGDAARGLSPDSAAVAPEPSVRALLPELFGALRALRGSFGAGLVVVIGIGGPHGGAALLAADPAEATARLPPGEPGFAAAVALEPGLAAFAAGDPPPPAERWDLRVPPLCGLLPGLAWTAAAGGGEGRAGRAPPHPRVLEAECLDRLLPARGWVSAGLGDGGLRGGPGGGPRGGPRGGRAGGPTPARR